MLSPIITTSGNGNRACHSASSCPTSYSGRSPVPLSPMTANFSVSGLFGSGTCACAAAPGWAAATATELSDGGGLAQQTSALRHSRNAAAGNRRFIAVDALPLLEGLRHPVRNDVRVRIEEDQILADEAVLELLGELRKILQDLGRHGRDRDFVGVAGARRQDDLGLGLVVHDLGA